MQHFNKFISLYRNSNDFMYLELLGRSSYEVIMALLLQLLGLQENKDFFTDRRIPLEWFWVWPGRRKITKYQIDLIIPKYNILIEVEGGRWHNTDEDKLSAQRKKDNLTLSGYLLIRKTDKELLYEYQTVLNEIKSILNRFQEPIFTSYQGEDKRLIWIADKIIEKLKETPEKTIEALHDELGIAETYVRLAIQLLEKNGIVTSLLSQYSHRKA